MKTEINVFRRGKVVFHSIEPKAMTEPQVQSQLKAWGVDTEHAFVQIIYYKK